jgi:hypothetical protein
MEEFIKKTLCGGDSVTYRYLREGKQELFRKRLKSHKDVEDMVYVLCTNILRDLVFEIIGKTTKHMEKWGDLVVSGGEAFNNYFRVEDRVVSTDIDTKFVPVFMSPFQKEFFGYLQYCKLRLWDHLGKVSHDFNKKFRERITLLTRTKLGKMIGIKNSQRPVSLKRRYTLIKKSPKDSVLIDVELFALDLGVKFYCPVVKKVSEQTLGGILDVAMMRPFEFGYEVAFTREKGITYKNPVSGKTTVNKNILIASKQFLIEDLYIMKKLGLRPTKVKKDKKRMITFSKKVLGLKGITTQTSDKIIFQKALRVLNANLSHKLPRNVSVPRVQNTIDPFKYEKYTTQPKLTVVQKLYAPGIKSRHYQTIPGFEKTNSRMYFNHKAETWKPTRNPYYVRNMYNFRPTDPSKVKRNPMNPQNVLYGRNRSRNNWVPTRVLQRAAYIPFVGLKKSDIKKVLK